MLSHFSSVQSLSRVWLFAASWISAHQASLSITNYQRLLKLVSIELVMPSSQLILCSPLLLLPTIPPSIRVFSSDSTLLMRWPKYWSFSFRISPSNEHPGLISFRMDWLDLFTVQGTLKSLLQHHSSKASILQCLAFFIVQLSHPYMTRGKTIALTRRTFVGKVMSLLFNMLSRLVITFLPRGKRLLISQLQSPSAVILEPPKIKFDTVSLSISHEVMVPDAMILVFWMLSFLLSSFTFKRLFSSSSLSAIRVVSSAYLRLLIVLPANLISAWASSSPVFLMMYSAYKLNKSLQLCPALCDPMDCSPPGFSVHGVPQARILEWVAIRIPRDRPSPGIKLASFMFPALAGRFFTTGTSCEAHLFDCHLTNYPTSVSFSVFCLSSHFFLMVNGLILQFLILSSFYPYLFIWLCKTGSCL